MAPEHDTRHQCHSRLDEPLISDDGFCHLIANQKMAKQIILFVSDQPQFFGSGAIRFESASFQCSVGVPLAFFVDADDVHRTDAVVLEINVERITGGIGSR